MFTTPGKGFEKRQCTKETIEALNSDQLDTTDVDTDDDNNADDNEPLGHSDDNDNDLDYVDSSVEEADPETIEEMNCSCTGKSVGYVTSLKS